MDATYWAGQIHRWYGRFSKTGKTSSDDIALVRAHGEQLAKVQMGQQIIWCNSPEYKAAARPTRIGISRLSRCRLSGTSKAKRCRARPKLIPGHSTNCRAVREATGRDLSEKQTKQAKEIAEGVKTANEERIPPRKRFWML